MKKFSKEEIDRAREAFIENGYQKVFVTLSGKPFDYFVLPQELEPRLPNFVMRITGEPNDGYVLGVSDEMDSRFRDYAVFHEFVEFRDHGMDTPDRCVRALEQELEIVPDNIKPEYLEMRAGFFRNLIPYCQAMPESYSSNDIEQFQKNLETLDAMLRTK